ncbi:hypothetical protein H4696_000767 [Amycolatopsis lexingtonensis]|uniref:Uncharacterized protein n=1 Tax=Amycolatopsis lexingtonensis TaxID=218822 RepID=A0ABR9HRV7_9PSEU|nr:DUF6529 family protein [Amycolatopsis lexingtonensis]MBE1493667.1 hypothetical protein [Amycolatopsis lexingtonensis]
MTTAGHRTAVALLVPLLAGAVVSVVLGVYGSLHTPTGVAVNVAGFSSPQSVKAWLATVVVVLAIVQLLSALSLYGKLGTTPAWMGAVHRWSGRVAFLVSIPVALHCLYALGFQSFDTRVLLHSLLGCFFYGAFVAKMLLLRRDGAPGWALPLLGGLVFTGLVGLWLSASLWFFTQSGLTF